MYRAFVALTFLFAFDEAGASEPGVPDFSRVSIEVHSVRRGTYAPEAELELHNNSDQVLFFSGYSVSSPVYSRQCVTNSESRNDDMGWCGTGLQTLSIDPGQRIEFLATLCFDSDATKVGLKLRARRGEAGATLWSPAIASPQRGDSDPMPSFDKFGASQQAFTHLKETGAAGALGKTLKLEPPQVSAFRVRSDEATECVPPGDYVLVQYHYMDRAAGGPNSIFYELPVSPKLRWIGDLSATSLNEAIDAFRAGALCRKPQ